jgi:hypothetical protein
MQGLRDPLKPHEYYAVSGEYLERIRKLLLRLYSEDRWKPDEMRDAAQYCEFIITEALHLP